MRSTVRLLFVIVLMFASIGIVAAEPFGRTEFRNVWQRTDLPVQQGRADHSWIWGPEAFTPVLEEWYVDSPGQRRAVQYLDKSRMEINDPNADRASEWYVTNGLLTRNMILGWVQVGNGKYIPLSPARVPIAGDPGNSFPTYADLARIFNVQPLWQPGQFVSRRFTPEGFADAPQYAGNLATQIVHVENGYGIPRAFRDFMTQGGTIYQNGRFVRATPLFQPIYVLGMPVSDAYWTRVRVGGTERDVMFQAFERRILTYTPDNPAQYRVEMGNIGRHYYQWRYVAPFSGGQRALITSPATGATINSPLTVQGFENGTAFEAVIQVRLVSNNGTLLAEQPTMVHRPDIQIPGPFETTLTWNAPAQPTAGKLQVFVESPSGDGSEQILASIDVTIAGSQ